MQNFLNTKWGSVFKAFLGVLLAYLLAHGGTLTNIGLSAWLGAIAAGLAAFLIKWISGNEDGFFNTWYGGLLKTFLLVGLAYIVEHNGVYGLNWGALLNAGLVAVITVVVNGANPTDTRYGVIKS